MENEHWKHERIEQDHYGTCHEPILFSTEGLGPCIGVCIAWNGWAGILHSSYIPMDEDDLVQPLFKAAKEMIPAKDISRVRPVVCGGDFTDHEGLSHDAGETEQDVMRARKRIIELLKEAGFGKPRIHWNTPGGRMRLIADLPNHRVTVELNGEELKSWPILQPQS